MKHYLVRILSGSKRVHQLWATTMSILKNYVKKYFDQILNILFLENEY